MRSTVHAPLPTMITAKQPSQDSKPQTPNPKPSPSKPQCFWSLREEQNSWFHSGDSGWPEVLLTFEIKSRFRIGSPYRLKGLWVWVWGLGLRIFFPLRAWGTCQLKAGEPSRNLRDIRELNTENLKGLGPRGPNSNIGALIIADTIFGVPYFFL